MRNLTVKGLARALNRTHYSVATAIKRGQIPCGTATLINERYTIELFPEQIKALYGEEILNKAIEYSKKGA